MKTIAWTYTEDQFDKAFSFLADTGNFTAEELNELKVFFFDFTIEDYPEKYPYELINKTLEALEEDLNMPHETGGSLRFLHNYWAHPYSVVSGYSPTSDPYYKTRKTLRPLYFIHNTKMFMTHWMTWKV